MQYLKKYLDDLTILVDEPFQLTFTFEVCVNCKMYRGERWWDKTGDDPTQPVLWVCSVCDEKLDEEFYVPTPRNAPHFIDF